MTGGYDGTARVWDLESPDPTASPRVLNGHMSQITKTEITRDGRWLVTASLDQKVRVRTWDLQSTDPTGNSRAVDWKDELGNHGNKFAVSPNGRWLVTAAGDFTARVWNLQSANHDAIHKVFIGHNGFITSCSFSRDSRWLVIASYDSKARL